MMNGNGKFTNANGDYFIGQFLNNQFNGKGERVKLAKKNPKAPKATYIGEFKDNLFEGYGEYEKDNRERYKGMFKAGLKHGKGVYDMIPLGSYRYEGTFENDEKSGYGVLTQFLETYEGNFKHDHYHGKGKLITRNFGTFTGEFVKGKFQSGVQVIKETGEKYEGNFKDLMIEGVGKCIFSNGTRYEGEFFGGKMDQKGKLFYKNGDVFEGNFLQGKKNGAGVLKLANGTCYEELWAQGEIVKHELIGSNRSSNNVKNNGPKIQEKKKVLLENVKEEDEGGKNQLTCIICESKGRNILFEPCLHLCCCEECSKKYLEDFKVCLVCRDEIKNTKKIFIA